jgi:hypothetical protein
MNYWSSAGLILDIIGVLIVFYYGLPSKVKITRKTVFHQSKEQENDEKRIRRKAQIGLALIVLGFILQFIGTNSIFCTKISSVFCYAQYNLT